MKIQISYTLFIILLLYTLFDNGIYAQESNNQIASYSLYWKSKLEYAFTKTFSSSHEFAACQVFQKLGYDLAEISEIRKITPFPASLTVSFEGILEDNVVGSSSEDIKLKVIRFKNIDVICNKVHYFNMIIERATFSFPDCTLEYDYLDKGRLKFENASEIKLNIKVSEKDILEILKLYPKSKLLSNVKVSLNPNRIYSSGRVKLGLIVAEYRLNGHIKQLSSKKVNFVSDRLKINGIPQPRAFVTSVMNYINPVYDSSNIWINLNIIDMKIIKGFVETNATINKKGFNYAN